MAEKPSNNSGTSAGAPADDTKPTGPATGSMDTELGRLVVEQKLASQEEVDRCRALTAETGPEASHQSFASVLIAQEVVTRGQIDRVRTAIEHRLGTEPHQYGEPLRKTLQGYWKLRVGDYRVVFKIVGEEVWILGIIHRKKVYEAIEKRV